MIKTTLSNTVFYLLSRKPKNIVSSYKNKSKLLLLSLVVTVLLSSFAHAQLAVPFTPRLDGGSVRIQGDIILIGNSIIGGEGESLPYNGNNNNNNFSAEYINVASGGNPNIFSSSTADLEINNSCKNIVYAGLYWASVYPVDIASGGQFNGTPRFEDWNEVKFKLPTGGFVDLVADSNPDPLGEEDDIIFDGYGYYSPGDVQRSIKDSPIICYKNVTSLLQGLTDADGTYTVANQRATTGKRSGGGAAGWTLVVIYESPSLPSKYISVFDGYAGVGGSTELDIPVSGFETLPAPLDVRAHIGVAALEGDLGLGGDSFLFRAATSANFTKISDARNPENNFFNSTITNNGGHMLNRNPASTNTLGFDINNVAIPNPNNGVLPNGATAGDLKLKTKGDGYGAFLATFAVDIIEPSITLTKVVKNASNINIGGDEVNLGDALTYVIGFRNEGNDDAKDFTIRDILPDNIIFDINTDLTLPSGVSVQSYDVPSREIIFKIEDYLVEQDYNAVTEIEIKVKVVETCELLSDACSNEIKNQAFATYYGVANPSIQITDDPSYNVNTGCLITPQATNFLADIDACNYTETAVLCGATVDLIAANGYSEYLWSRDPSGSPVIHTGQTFTASSAGTYYVYNVALAPCRSITQTFEVTPFNGFITNPVLPFADDDVVCPDNGKILPYIYLCGASDERVITTNNTNATSIIWQVLDESSCTAVTDEKCANEDANCSWTDVSTEPNYTAKSAGQYRIILNYAGGCFNRFYFNVYQNLLNPQVTPTDVYCTTLGQIDIDNVPANGYEFSLNGTNYQDSKTFTGLADGVYTAYVRQKDLNFKGCVFEVNDIRIAKRDLTITTTVKQPDCYGNKGEISIAANGVREPYTYTVFKDGVEVNRVGPITDVTQTYPGLDSGNYRFQITTADGCLETVDVEIINSPPLSITAAITTPLTCNDGEITVSPVGGTEPYYYFVNGATTFQTVPEIAVTTAGTYNIRVVDGNNCEATYSMKVDKLEEPVYTVIPTDVSCYGDNTGVIQFNVTNYNGYTLEYSIDNGASYHSNATFSNLDTGDYNAVVKYFVDASNYCYTTAETVTINEPYVALTATAGVSELAGCGPAGAGKIRITNPQGGTPFAAPNLFEYSFDNQNSWITTNEAYMAPGTYTVYIRDANGCIYAMKDIVLDQKPPAPTITVGDTDFNCDGTGNATVTVTNSGSSSYSYKYYLNGNLNTNTADPTTFLNVPSGDHSIRVEYTLLAVPTFSNLLYETFGYGEDTTSPGINTDYYCFERQVDATKCNGSISINDGDYVVTSRIKHPFGTWVNPIDYTPATIPPTPNGRYLVVNIGGAIPVTTILYEKEINDIIPNQPIQVEFAAINLLKSTSGGYDPDLRVALVDASGNEISSYSTGKIPKTENWIKYPTTPITLNPGAHTSLKFILKSNVRQNGGNDVAIDDLKVYQLPVSCATPVDFPFVVPTGKAFTASITGTSMISCSNTSNGTITIAAENFDPALGFQYSIDNVPNWVTQMTSPHTITGLSKDDYTIQIRNDNTAEACEFALPETEITSAAPLTVSATHTEVTCLDGATITAKASGGIPGYTFELIDTAAPFNVTPFGANGILTNVPAGTYTLQVTDALGCNDSAVAGTTITLNGPSPLVAEINRPASNFCYTNVNAATIKVNVTSGQGPYQYNINGGSYQPNDTFTNLTPGTYAINVRDNSGCVLSLPTETIAPQLELNTVITKNLDCSAAPDAIITGTINGGTAPYTYTVSIGGALPYTTITNANPEFNTTATGFTYNASTNDMYQFQVFDALGCEVLSAVNTINAPTNPTGTATGIDPLCFNGTDGQIQLSGAGGSGGYKFSFNGSSFTTQSLYTGLNANTTTATTTEYTYQIKDSNNCVSPIYTMTLNKPTEVMASASLSTGCKIIDVTVSATGGAGNYGYSFNGSSSYTANNVLTVAKKLATQNITYSVRDANGCIDTETIEIPAFKPLLGVGIHSDFVTCDNPTVTATVEPTLGQGVAPFVFEITAPASAAASITHASQGEFTGLTAGNYTFRITDANGCERSRSITIPTAPQITVASTNTDQICAGSDDGIATFTIENFLIIGSGNYDYQLTTTAGTPVAVTPTVVGNEVTYNGLSPESYTFNVKDNRTGCTASTAITINPVAAINFTANASNINCNNAISTISYPTLSGGTGGYTYAYVSQGDPAPGSGDYSTSRTVDTAVLGLNIDVYVKDSNNCVVTTPITITSDPLPTVTASVINQCSATGSNFIITATATGEATLLYSIDGTNFQTGNTFNVSAGAYTVTVKDGNGCTVSTNTPVTVSPQLTLSAIFDNDIMCTATVPLDAQVTLNAAGGDGSYTYEYSTDGGSNYTTMGGSNVLNTSTPGSYIFRVTDGNTCVAETTVTAPIVITAPVDPDITVAQIDTIDCFGEETASISITPDTTLGQAPYTYEVVNTTTTKNYGSQTSGLAAGVYEVTITDARGCTEVETINIGEPNPLHATYDTVQIICNTTTGASKGSVIVLGATGGNGPYDYYVTSTNGYSNSEHNLIGDTSVNFDVVDFGLYQINVVDVNGCSFLVQDVLIASPIDDLDITINTTSNCLTGGEAVVSIGTTLAGTGPFYFDIYKGFVPPAPPLGTWKTESAVGSKSATFPNLVPGVTYTFIVYDAVSRCTYYETAAAPIDSSSTLTTSALSENNITCTGADDGNVSFDISSVYGTPTNVTYEIYDSLSIISTGITGAATVPANGSWTVPNLGPLPFGNYFVLITETSGPNSGCGVATNPFYITESENLFSVSAAVSSNETCDNLGIITAKGKDGTAPYQYQILLDTAAAPDATSTTWDTVNTFTVPAGDYIVYAMDAYGCIKDFAVALIKDPEPTINTPLSQCFVGAPITVTITGGVSVGTAMYTITKDPNPSATLPTFVSSPDFTIYTPGDYLLYIQDGNGCVTSTPYKVYDQLVLSAALTKELDCTASPDAEITLTASGGDNTTYTYEVNVNGGGFVAYTPTSPSPFIYATSTVGTHEFRVTDAQACSATTTYTLNPVPNTTFTTAEVNVSCNGGSDGSITVTTTSGSGPFTYQLDDGIAPVITQSNSVFSGLSQGSYVVTVIDSRSCSYSSASITITQPSALSASHSFPANTSCDVETVITVSGSGGTPITPGNYEYNFNGTGFSTTNTFTVNNNGTPQTVNYTVRDANGCLYYGSETIASLDPPTDLTFTATPITCVSNNPFSDVTLTTTTGGVGILSYEILSPASATTNTTGASSGIFTGLAPGDYMFSVTDANGCAFQELFTLDVDQEKIAVIGRLISDVTCNPGANGEVVFDVSNFSGTYSYSINGGTTEINQSSSTITVSGLTGPSTQTINITDETTGCTATATVNVIQPAALGLTLDSNTNANCNVGAQVSVTATGGTGTYSYSFVERGDPAGTFSSSSTAVLDPAASTTWDVYVQDANGCVITAPLEITIATDPIPTGITFTGSQCISATNDYSFTVNVTSGVGSYEFNIGNGYQVSDTFTVNAPGTYNVTVLDANGCTNTATYIIDNPIGLTLVPVPPSCTDNDGVITATGFGGKGVYTYTINSSLPTQSANVFSGVPSGTYDVTITDTTTGCTNTETITLDSATPVTFTLDKQDVTCNGSSDGVITVDLPVSNISPITNNEPIYTYEITSGPSTATAQTSNVFEGLAAGNYTVRVNSGKNCFHTENITINEPAAIVLPAPTVSQYGCSSGNTLSYASITVDDTAVTGGSGNYRYEFIKNGNRVQFESSNTFTEADFTGGTYTVNVYDDKDCTGTPVIAIINPYIALDDINIVVDTAITCTNLEDITVTAITTGGTPTNLQYTVEDVVGITSPGLPITNSTGTFTGLDIGNYIITVDNLDTGCSLKKGYYVNNPNTFNLIIDNVVDVTCSNDNNGSVDITFVDLVVSGSNLDQAGPFRYTITNTITSTSTSGTAPDAGPISITGLEGGTYTVEAILDGDPFCTVTKNFTITRPTVALSVIATEASNVTCANNLGSIQAIATGGWSTVYEFQLMLGTTEIRGYSANNLFTGLEAGNYTVNVKNTEGCIATDFVTLTRPTAITANVVPSTIMLSCFGAQDASITISNVIGGQGSNYKYTLNTILPTPSSSGPQTNNVFDNLGAGTYTVTVTDGYNCEFNSGQIVIRNPAEIEANLVRTRSQTCLTGSELTLSASGGTGPYEYSDDSAFSTIRGNFNTSTTIAVAEGTFSYYVRDANGCISNASNTIKIDPLPTLVVSLDTRGANIICTGDASGIIIATAQGGLGNYVYTLQDTAGNAISPVTQNSPGVFTELPVGVYQVSVQSGDCPEISAQASVTEPSLPLVVASPIITNSTCYRSNNGSIKITASGGSGNIKYAISPRLNQFFETSTFENLAPASYQVIVQDASGCFEVLDFNITEPDRVLLGIVPGSLIPEDCYGDLDGEFSVNITGGTAPYSVSLDDFNGPYNTGGATQTEFHFINLAGGDRVVYVRDANGCESEWNIPFPESVLINPAAVVDYGCTNNLSTNIVTVSVDASVNPLDLDYALNGGAFQSSNVFIDVPPGLNHFIDVRHSNGCVQRTTGFDIDYYNPLTSTLEDGELNEIIVTTTGGAGNNEFTLNGESMGSTNTFYIYESGDYTITVTDRYGCVSSVTQYFEYIDVCIPNYFTPNNDGNQDEWGPDCTSQYKNLTFDIFDRHGRKIRGLRAGEKWDGTYNGIKLPTGDYWYIVKLNDSKDNREFVGHFTLYR